MPWESESRGDAYEKIHPFSLAEQKKLLSQLSEHWKSYFAVAFGLGLRPGEQIAIKPEDIDWEKRILNIRRAMTIDLEGKVVEGNTKNKYSRRAIKLFPVMYEAMLLQKKIWETLRCNYFFSTESGKSIHRSNLRRRVWLPALKKAGLKVREMKQTRHTFATIALASGENPLWVSNVMGHRNAEMVIKVYSKYVENAAGTNDGNRMNSLLVKGKVRQG